LTLMLLGGLTACANTPKPHLTQPLKETLPAPSADVQRCFTGAISVPKKALSKGEVEKLWKQDRLRSIKQQQCGKRLLARDAELRKRWR
jgi:hypothetical protein